MTDLEQNNRLRKIIENGFGVSPVEFAKAYDDVKAVKTYNILSGRNGISKKMLEMILAAYPTINKVWLLTGQGSMLTDTNEIIEEVSETIGYYYPDVSASAGLNTEILNSELDRVKVKVPNMEEGLTYINVYGDSMYPRYCSGDVIAIKQIEPRFVSFGHIYVVVFTDGQVFVKYVKKGRDNDHLLLVSENKFYDEQEYHKEDIRSLFVVKGKISKETI